MTFTFPAYSFIFLVGGLVCSFLAIAVWYRRPSPGAIPLTMLLLAAWIWNITAFFEAGALELSTRIILTKISYLGIVSIGVFWLAFVLDYSGSNWWKRPRNFILLSIIPVVTLAIAWTNELHGWQWSRIYLTYGPLGLTSVWKHGPWYLVNPIYQYGLYILGMILLFRYGFRRPRIYLTPVIICLAGTTLPIIGSILYVSGINPAAGFDVTPFYISAASIIYSVAIFQYRFIDITPVAYRLMAKNIHDGVLILDSRSHIVEINPVVERILKRNKTSVRGNQLFEVWPDLIQAIATSGELHHAEMDASDGNLPLYLDISVSNITDSHRKTAGKLVILQDITIRKQLENKIIDLYTHEKIQRQELQEEAKARGMFIDILAHELRTPMTPILASIEMLKDLDPGLEESVRKRLINNVYASSQMLTSRLEELLDFARFSRGTFKLKMGPIELRQFFEEAVSRFKPSLGKKKQQLVLKLPEKLPVVSVDASKLEQVLVNLLSNASKFSPEGSTIKLIVSLTDFELQVDVEDQGIGISPEAQERLFQPYHRAEQDRQQFPGLGLGLAVSKQIVEAHSGSIWLTSQPGNGSTFSFQMPLKGPVNEGAAKNN